MTVADNVDPDGFFPLLRSHPMKTTAVVAISKSGGTAETNAQLAIAIDALKKANGALVVTADHGNCETMVDPVTGGPHTAHTTNPVPVILFGGPEGAKLHDAEQASGNSKVARSFQHLPHDCSPIGLLR